jgi:hypothetical protein
MEQTHPSNRGGSAIRQDRSPRTSMRRAAPASRAYGRSAVGLQPTLDTCAYPGAQHSGGDQEKNDQYGQQSRDLTGPAPSGMTTKRARSARDLCEAGRAQMVCYRAPANYQGECEWTCRRAFIPLIDGTHPHRTCTESAGSLARIPRACAALVFKDGDGAIVRCRFAVWSVPGARRTELMTGLCSSRAPARPHDAHP